MLEPSLVRGQMNLGVENETTEFKSSMSQLDKGIIGLTAMLNRHNHGTLYIGVDDNGNVIGMDVSAGTLETVRNRIRSFVQPQIVPEISRHETDDGKSYISVHVTGFNIPYSCDGRYYIRNVSSNESAGPDVVAQLVMARGIDPLKNQKSDLQELTFNTLFGIMVTRDLHPRKDAGFYRSHGMVDEHGMFNLTAYLVSDQNSIPMQVVRFNGTDRTAVSSRTDFGGQSLIASARAILEHVSSYMLTTVDLSSGERTESNLFDFDAFREAWINACVHNSWSALIPPSVLVFFDRIEIVSYGRIPFPISMDDFFNGDSRPVNRSLFELFTLVGLTEQSGHGVPTIVRSYGREAFHITDNGMVVTIPFAFEPDFAKTKKAIDIDDLDEDSRIILCYLDANPNAKLSDVAEKTGISLSSVKKMVSSLKSEGHLKNDGTNRNSRWVVL